MSLRRTELFAAVPPGLEAVCAAEIAALGIENTRIFPGGVSFEGDFETVCLANLALRTASRVLLRIDRFFAVHLAQLHKKAGRIPWEEYLPADRSVEVRAACRKSRIYHSAAAAERVAKGIAERLGLTELPGFGEGAPDEAGGATCILLRIERDHCTVSVDTSGAHLHRRGYRTRTGIAPLRETLAASVLRLCEWSPDAAALVDPMCGTGTFPIEAALAAARIPPGRQRTFGFEALPFHKADILSSVKERLETGIRTPPRPIIASDISEDAVRATRDNAEHAGVLDFIETRTADAATLSVCPVGAFVVCNPPYGKRIGERRRLRELYLSLGEAVRGIDDARLAVVTDDPSFAAATGADFSLVSAPFPNGGIRVRVYST